MALVIALGLLLTEAPPLAPPTAAQAAPAPTATVGSTSTFETEVFQLLNGERQKIGLLPLRYDQRLGDAADFHNTWMATNNCFAHVCSGEPDVPTRIMNAGYPPPWAFGEILAQGSFTPSTVVAAWMNSPSHKSTILWAPLEDVGCGYRSPSCWTCDFASGGNVATPVPSLTVTPTATATSAATATATAIPTSTFTPSPTLTSSLTPTVPATLTPAATPSSTPRSKRSGGNSRAK